MTGPSCPRSSAVSGEPPIVSLVADPARMLERLVRALDTIDQAGMGEWCLIGGVAVMCRLAEAHRVTQDLDTLVRSATGEGAMELLLEVATSTTPTGSALLADGTKVDVIEVTRELDEEALPEDTLARMFPLSHFFMATTAETVSLELRAPDQTLIIRRPLLLARPAALVAPSSRPSRPGAPPTRPNARPMPSTSTVCCAPGPKLWPPSWPSPLATVLSGPPARSSVCSSTRHNGRSAGSPTSPGRPSRRRRSTTSRLSATSPSPRCACGHSGHSVRPQNQKPAKPGTGPFTALLCAR